MKIKNNIIANSIGHGWVTLMGLVFIPFYIYYLGMEAFGLVIMFSLLQSAFLMLDAGMTPTLTRAMAGFNTEINLKNEILNLLRSIEIVTLIISIVSVFCIFIISEWIAIKWIKIEKLSEDIVENSILYMAILVTLRLFEGIYRGCLIGLQKQVILNVIGGGIATFRGLLTIVLLSNISPTIEYFFISQIIVSSLAVVIYAYVVYERLSVIYMRPRFSVQILIKNKNYTIGMFGTTILSYLLTQTDKIILSTLLPLEKFAYYGLASIVSGIIFHVITPIWQGFTPRLNQFASLKDKKLFINDFHMASQLITIIAGSFFALLYLYSPNIILLWTNDIIISNATSKVLGILAFGNLLNALMWVPASAYHAYGFTKVSLLLNLYSLFYIIPSLFIVVPIFGVDGAAYIWVALNSGYHIFGIVKFFSKIEGVNKMDWYINDIIKPLLPIIMIILILKYNFILMGNFFIQIFYLVIILIVMIMVSLLFCNKINLKVLFTK
jgi:O-antigen/teichoic acid export membrane protein